MNIPNSLSDILGLFPMTVTRDNVMTTLMQISYADNVYCTSTKFKTLLRRDNVRIVTVLQQNQKDATEFHNFSRAQVA